MRETLTVAAVQAYAKPGAISVNAARAAALVSQAADSGADLVVLPELFLSAYHLETLSEDPAGTDVTPGDARLDPLRRVARDRAVVIVVGAAVRQPDATRTCSALVVDRSGTVHDAYHKQNLWGSEERALFAPGTRGATLFLDGWRFGLGVCYDGCFPEHGRDAMADDVHGLLYPSAYVRGSEHRRDIYYPARALDNTCYVVFANQVGGDDPWWFNGGAAIYDPEGRTLARGPAEGDRVEVATLRAEALAVTRRAHPMLRDRPRDSGGPRGRCDC